MNHSDFKAAWWLRSPHLQTLWPTLCRRPIKNLVITRERFELPDGDFIDLDWVGNNNRPIVILLHGLEGSIHSSYAKGMLNAIQNQGWRGVFMHFRCCSGEPNRLSRLYHSGETEDIAAVVHAITQREPETPLAAIGFSLGANVLLKWLGETNQQNPLKAAIAVSTPFELGKLVNRVNQGFSRVYQRYLLKKLHKKIQFKFQTQPAPIPIPPHSGMRTLRDFDEHITAPLHGFRNAEDYYTTSSSRQYLGNIAVPTLLLQSKDDPFMTEDLLPDPSELSAQVILELMEKGGHLGFVSGPAPWRAQYWLENRAPRFLRSYLQQPEKR
ncbi:MAG TPA: hydrolase [Gammaproteobacteria bacterium]|jgi:hypothetical protein|nr:hydrolase [Gammaproteobacteria bacterium]